MNTELTEAGLEVRRGRGRPPHKPSRPTDTQEAIATHGLFGMTAGVPWYALTTEIPHT